MNADRTEIEIILLLELMVDKIWRVEYNRIQSVDEESRKQMDL